MNGNGLATFGVPRLPKWFLFLRIAVIVLSLGTLVAAAYNLSLYDEYITFSSGPAGFLIFDVRLYGTPPQSITNSIGDQAVFTWLILGVMIGFEFFVKHLYYRLAFVVFLTLDAIFWLSAWAWAASWAGRTAQLRYLGGGGYFDNFYGSLTAAAVLGAFVW